MHPQMPFALGASASASGQSSAPGSHRPGRASKRMRTSRALTFAVAALTAALSAGLLTTSTRARVRTHARASAPVGAAAARRAAADAYVYGVPLLNVLNTLSLLPVNTAVSSGVLTTAAQRLVVLPNEDTLYTLVRLDLRGEPQVLHVPDTGGRYYTMELLDAYTNVIANVGRRATGTHTGEFAITGPGWRGTLPAGVRQVRATTPDVWIIGRTLIAGPSDLTAARAIQTHYTVFPLSALGTTREPATSLVLTSPPSFHPPKPPYGLAFLDQLGRALASDPPPARDVPLLRRLAAGGVGPGRAPSQTASLAARRAWLAGLRDGRARVTAFVASLRRRSVHRAHGWTVLGPKVGRFGTDYLTRAAVATLGLGANVPQEAVYPIAMTDSAGRTLTGTHRYVVRFAAGQLPPVDAFWSLTLYGADLFFYPNPLMRYAVGDRSGLHLGPGGSLSIAVSHVAPADRTNWLPAPPGRFVLALRLYQPRAAVLSGRWPLPLIARQP